MSDYLIRATAKNAQIRAFACHTTEMVEYARQIHEMSPVVTAALGRLLTGSSMMGKMLKGEKDLLTIQIKGDGLIQGLTVTADSQGTVKGYAEEPVVIIPANSIGKLDVGGAVGKGFLRVVKDMGMKEPYSSQVELQTGEIGDDLTYYFAVSEQVPSSVGLGVLMDKNNTVKQAGGFIVQLMPFAEEETIEKLESNLNKINSVTSLFDQGYTPESILELILEGLECEILEKSEVKFECGCSKSKIEKALISLGKAELSEMIRDQETIEINCHFCNSHYNFSVDELKGLYQKASK